MAALPQSLGQIIVPPTPRRSAGMSLDDYEKAVDVWTRQVEQALRTFERTVNSINAYLAATQKQLVPAGGTTGQKLTKSSNADFADGWA